ncbi:MAG TPA: CBS domain-containing protein [Trebonia sp.]|jgi:CBS domain-containing protein/sporulation protein YlmC with PRC-barrel domain|nr:CBS domain-containing protein [Trebonia sp.]
MAERPSPPSVAALRARYEQRVERLTTLRHVRSELVSLAGLIGKPVMNQAGEQIGRVADAVARWDSNHPYPPVTGLIVRIGRRRAWLAIETVEVFGRDQIRLRTARLDLREVARRPGEAELARDVIDHQLVDTDGARVIRASDLYLARVAGVVQLVGVDVGFNSLLRRLGPARFRSRPTPDKVIDWASITSFGSQHGPAGTLQASGRGLQRLRPGELADLLEDLGRTERRDLLAQLTPEQAADALEEMQEEELVQLLRESGTADAARLLGRMEPDEAADGLRELEPDEREKLLAAMPAQARDRVATLLGYGERTAGGIMTTVLVTATPAETITQVRDRLRANMEHDEDLAGVIVLGDDGRLLDDVTMTELFLADPGLTIDDLIGPPWPVTVTTDAGVDEIAERLVQTRHSSVVVVDEEERPLGRILVDDVLDMLVPDRPRFRFPRRLS